MSTKPPIGLMPRHFWFRERTKDCIDALYRLHDMEDWELYKELAAHFAHELLYCTTEWDKYYKEGQ